jgi:capsular polysaccharide biosynthesis protein
MTGLEASLTQDLPLIDGQNVSLIQHAWAYGSAAPKSLYALSAANELLIEGGHWARGMAGKCFLRHLEDDGACQIDLADYPLLGRHEEPALLIGSPNNWGHWVADHLPLLAHLDLHPDLSGRKLVMHELHPMHRECLDLLGINLSRVIETTANPAPRGRHIFNQLAIPGNIPLPLGYAYIRKRLFANLEGEAGGPERVYLSRAKFEPRHRVFNEEEVQDLFRRRGFAIVHPETLSVRETLDLMQSADIVAMQLGAGFGNAPLARPDAVQIHLLPDILLNRIDDDPVAAFTMRYYAALPGQTLIVPGRFDLDQQRDYAARHRLDALDSPYRFEASAIDTALLEAEKLLMLGKLGILK